MDPTGKTTTAVLEFADYYYVIALYLVPGLMMG